MKLGGFFWYKIFDSKFFKYLIKFMTNQHLIFQLGKMVGLDKSYLDKLYQEYLSADEDRRYQIMEILWDGFFKLLDKITELKFQQFIYEAALGKRKLTDDLYQKARQAAKEYLFKTLTGEIEDEQKIEEIRKKIFSFVN